MEVVKEEEVIIKSMAVDMEVIRTRNNGRIMATAVGIRNKGIKDRITNQGKTE